MRMALALVLSVLALSCSSSQEQLEETTPRIAQISLDNLWTTPEQEQFYNAYRELVCKTNMDYDPLDDMATIREPVDFLSELASTDDNRQKYYLPTLKKHGFDTVKAFLDTHASLKVSAPRFIEARRDSVQKVLEECQLE